MLKQPLAGVAACALIIVISLIFISLFTFPVFSGWVSFLLLCMIPVEIVAGVTWGGNPKFAAEHKQPLKGIVITAACALVGAIVAAIHYPTVGGAVSPPTPMLAMCMIISVITTFWGAIMWGGWPFTALIKNPVTAGLTLLAACYLVNFCFFRIFFDYGFMRGAPVYVPSLDPHGMFNAWSALVYFVTASAFMFLMLHFDLWPLNKFPSIMKQPVLGVVWTVIVVALGAAAFIIGVDVLKMDVVAFMIKVPIPFIFGTIVVLNMLQGSLYAKLEQPLKGVLNTVTAIVVGLALAQMYSWLAPVVTGNLKPGPPAYDYEIWLASALLAVTFPFLVLYADFFRCWPLKKAE